MPFILLQYEILVFILFRLVNIVGKHRAILLAAAAHLTFATASGRARAQSLPAIFSPTSVDAKDVQSVTIGFKLNGRLAWRTTETEVSIEPRSEARYRASTSVYLDENGALFKRFVVHTVDAGDSAVGRRCGRFLAALWTCANRRFGTLSPGLRREPLDVWLSRSGEAGGEQFRTNLYIHDLGADRTPVEWARELAHEYGHFLLPGASGYTEPENWANGVLGERLFFKWIREDIALGRLSAADVEFLDSEMLDEFNTKQIQPLLDRARSAAPDTALLAGKTSRAMNAFTGLLLCLDDLHGSSMLLELLDYLPAPDQGGVGGVEFLRAYERRMHSTRAFQTTIHGDRTQLFLAKGEYKVTSTVGLEVLFIDGVSASGKGKSWIVSNAADGWKQMHAGPRDARLTWDRR